MPSPVGDDVECTNLLAFLGFGGTVPTPQLRLQPCLCRRGGYVSGVSTTALHIIGLVKSLPEAEQQEIRAALAAPAARRTAGKRRQLQRLPDGTFFNPDGIPNDDPIFKVLEDVEVERHRMPGPPAPQFD
jgi:hypothetical protein